MSFHQKLSYFRRNKKEVSSYLPTSEVSEGHRKKEKERKEVAEQDGERERERIQK